MLETANLVCTTTDEITELSSHEIEEFTYKLKLAFLDDKPTCDGLLELQLEIVDKINGGRYIDTHLFYYQ